MNVRLAWYKATHHLFHGENWLLVIGPDIWCSDWGISWKRGNLPPNSISGEWRRWRVEWRINVRWPITISRKVSK